MLDEDVEAEEKAVAGVIGTGRGNRGRGNPEEFAALCYDMRAAHAWTILVTRSMISVVCPPGSTVVDELPVI